MTPSCVSSLPGCPCDFGQHLAFRVKPLVIMRAGELLALRSRQKGVERSKGEGGEGGEARGNNHLFFDVVIACHRIRNAAGRPSVGASGGRATGEQPLGLQIRYYVCQTGGGGGGGGHSCLDDDMSIF